MAKFSFLKNGAKIILTIPAKYFVLIKHNGNYNQSDFCNTHCSFRMHIINILTIYIAILNYFEK